MSKKALTVLVIVLCALLAAIVAAYAVSAYGTPADPLVAKSYLDEVLRPELEEEMQRQLDALERSDGAYDGRFRLLVLSAGQSVICDTGTQVLPRLGTLYAAGADFPVLVDTSTGANVSDGDALSANHLYMVTIQGNGFRADADNTKLLISGSYTVLDAEE